MLYEYRNNQSLYKKRINDVAASFQNAVVDVLVQKTVRAAVEYKAKSVIMAGGVAANKFLRSELKKACTKEKIKLFVPEFIHCTDNATMIAAAAYFKAKEKKYTSLNKVKADPNWEIV